MDCCHISGAWRVSGPHGGHHCGELWAPGTQVCLCCGHWHCHSYTEDLVSDIALGCDWHYLMSPSSNLRLPNGQLNWLSVTNDSLGRHFKGLKLFLDPVEECWVLLSHCHWAVLCSCHWDGIRLLTGSGHVIAPCATCYSLILASSAIYMSQMWALTTLESPEVSLPSHQSLVFTPRLCFIDAG